MTTPHPPATSALNALVDLEKELSCSICTDVLYHPLTLLDCLHTFCGSCLKEWFSSQRLAVERKIRQEGRAPPVVYTCPSCRAHVRDTRPNASVTTLLDMYLSANPAKNKTEKEKAELDAIYKRGDVVIPEPPVIPETDSSDEEADRRMLQEVRQLTIDQMGSSRQDHRRTRHDDGRTARQDDRRIGQARRSRRNTGDAALNAQETRTLRPQTALERESSIRSLFSSSSFDSAEMEAEIMQQVVQGGLLDGIDLRNLSPQQEDEIIQRIAEAYRRQQKEKRQRARERSQARRALAERRPREDAAHPPLSRPYLLETASDGPAQPRSNSRGNDPSPPDRSDRGSRRSSGDRIRPASRSATDLTLRPQSRSRQADDGSNRTRRSRLPSQSRERRATDPQSRSLVEAWRNGASSLVRDGITRTSATASPQQRASATASELTTTPNSSNESVTRRPAIIPAPARSCASCGKQNIERRLHYGCHKCTDNVTKPYTLCQQCYRQGKGCLHWFGFAHAATARFEHQSPSTSIFMSEPPHIMRAERYVVDAGGNAVLQHGKFCDVCNVHSDACYWSCDICNDGDWGYCDTCVGQARHCTHSLLATALDGPVDSDPLERKVLSLQVRLPCSICRKDIPLNEQHVHCPTCNDGDYDVCMPCYQALIANGTIFHSDGLNGWRKCPRSHRMLLVTFISRTRKSSPAIALTDRSRPERLILQNVVGGWALKETNVTHADNNLVPNQWSWRDTEAAGGWMIKQRSDHAHAQRATSSESLQKVQALWTRIPDEEAKDELTFPRGAEITEVVNINGDWAWGIFCRSGGLFPANYGRVLES